MTILWDWNGTLVADVPHVVEMNNLVLEQFGYRHTSEEEYRAKFRHPVHEYYYDLGVTEEDFPKIAKVWNKAYVEGFDRVPLAPGAADCAFIGDTTHDAETAAAIGCRCFLVEGGHQERSVLETAENAQIMPSLDVVLTALGC